MANKDSFIHFDFLILNVVSRLLVSGVMSPPNFRF